MTPWLDPGPSAHVCRGGTARNNPRESRFWKKYVTFLKVRGEGGGMRACMGVGLSTRSTGVESSPLGGLEAIDCSERRLKGGADNVLNKECGRQRVQCA